jgi:hypothetical protein
VPLYQDEDHFDHQVLELGGFLSSLLAALSAHMKRRDEARPAPTADPKEIWAEDCTTGPADQSLADERELKAA